MASSLRLCRDCRFYREDTGPLGYAKCDHPRLVTVDLVSGTVRPHHCDVERRPTTPGWLVWLLRLPVCGQVGRFWTPRDAG